MSEFCSPFLALTLRLLLTMESFSCFACMPSHAMYIILSHRTSCKKKKDFFAFFQTLLINISKSCQHSSLTNFGTTQHTTHSKERMNMKCNLIYCYIHFKLIEIFIRDVKGNLINVINIYVKFMREWELKLILLKGSHKSNFSSDIVNFTNPQSIKSFMSL